MFKITSAENELIQTMSQQLKKSAEKQNETVTAVEKLNKAAQLLDDIGLYSASDKLLEVLESVK